MTLPFTIEKILAAAASDPAFCAELLEGPAVACARRGYMLSETERAVLCSVSKEQLATMIANVAGRPIPVEQPQVVCTGVRPEDIAKSRGIRPDVPMAPQGIRPDRPEGGGRRGRGRGVVVAAAAGAVITGAAAGAFLMVTGSRPDPPPVTSPVEKKAEDESGEGGKPPSVGADAGQKDAGPDGAP